MREEDIVVPAPGYGGAMKRHNERSRAARRRDEATTAERVVDDPRGWEPSRNDLRGVDDAKRGRVESVRHADYEGDDPGYHHGVRDAEDAWHAAEKLGTVAPIQGNPSMDPATGDMVAVSYMAGYADDTPVGFDAMQGVDRMVTGAADATEDLRVESATAGGPLEVAPEESVYEDSYGLGTHDLAMDGDEDREDWCSALRCHTAEGAGGWL